MRALPNLAVLKSAEPRVRRTKPPGWPQWVWTHSCLTVSRRTSSLSHRLADATHIIVCAGPDERGDPVLNALGGTLKSGMPGLEWIGYLSTVGVYGDHDGAWVDEDTPCKPVSQRSVERVKAEAAWQAFAASRNLPLAILRLSGIYGPGRNTFVNLADGSAKRIIKPGQYFNRIHVADIAGSALFLGGKARRWTVQRHG